MLLDSLAVRSPLHPCAKKTSPKHFQTICKSNTCEPIYMDVYMAGTDSAGRLSLLLVLLIPSIWLRVPYSKTRAVSAPGKAAEGRGWLTWLEMTSREEMFPWWTTKRAELQILVCVLWKILGICYLLPCYLAQDCLRCYEVGWAGLG